MCICAPHSRWLLRCFLVCVRVCVLARAHVGGIEKRDQQQWWRMLVRPLGAFSFRSESFPFSDVTPLRFFLSCWCFQVRFCTVTFFSFFLSRSFIASSCFYPPYNSGLTAYSTSTIPRNQMKRSCASSCAFLLSVELQGATGSRLGLRVSRRNGTGSMTRR